MEPRAIEREDIGSATRLFALSFRQRDEIAQVATRAGWHATVIASGDEVEAAYRASGATVALVDARGASGDGLAATRALGGLVAANGDALLVLVSHGDIATIGDFHDAGATQFLSSPASEGEIVQALRFAARHAARAGGRAIDRRLSPDDRSPERAYGRPHDRPDGRNHHPDADDARRWIGDRIAAGRPVTVVLIALSRLDIVNAAHGRPAVDALIETAVARVDGIARGGVGAPTMVARLGGADLVLAIEAAGAVATTAIIALDAALARPFAVADALAVVGCRFGVAERRPDDDAVDVLRRAGDALAEAKASDGSMLHIAATDAVVPLDRLAIDLHHAIERDEIDIRFQPQVEIVTGRITGVEALARWDHATLGPLGADALFAAAERADLGIALSDHIQRLVLARALAWPAILGTLRVSLNLTAADIARPGFAALFLARIDESGFPRGRLTGEITETGLIGDLAAAAALLAELRGAGCRVAIDDFGTGYSSLAYLKALPLDYVKIDKALVRDIDGSPRDRVVVAGAITMARSLGLAVIAEGVETPAQLDLLAASGCSLYQGFLLSEPIAEAALIELMER